MFEDDEEDKTIYKVVVNHEEQYSIWPPIEKRPCWNVPVRRIEAGMPRLY